MEKLIETVSDTEKQQRIHRVALGLGYIAVQLENGHVGLSANIVHTRTTNCTVFKKAGTLRGSSVGDVLALGMKTELLPRAICLATINALKNTEGCGQDADVFDQISIQSGDRVAMIGLIEPIVKMLTDKGCEVSVYEHRSVDHPLVKDAETQETTCAQADIVIVTATSIINNTFENIIKNLGTSREVILMGPSTPMVRERFLPTPITYLAGSVVVDPEKTLEIVMEGGGTQALYRYNAIKKTQLEVHP